MQNRNTNDPKIGQLFIQIVTQNSAPKPSVLLAPNTLGIASVAGHVRIA